MSGDTEVIDPAQVLKLEPGHEFDPGSRSVLNRIGSTVRHVSDDELVALGYELPTNDVVTAQSAAELRAEFDVELVKMRAATAAMEKELAELRAARGGAKKAAPRKRAPAKKKAPAAATETTPEA